MTNTNPAKKAQLSIIVVGRGGKMRICRMRPDIPSAKASNSMLDVPAGLTLRQAVMQAVADEITKASEAFAKRGVPVNMEIFTIGQVAIKYYQMVPFLKGGNYMTTEDIIAEYEYYHGIAHTYNSSDIKSFDKELKHPAHTNKESSSNSLFMFYDLILPDEKIDHIASFNIDGTESSGAIEFTMKMRIHDRDRALEIYNAFVEHYSEGSQGSEYYDMLHTFDKGVRIKVDDSHDWIVGYKKVKSDNGFFYVIHVSEDYK